MTSAKRNIALILIDYQQGFYNPQWGKRNLPEAEKNATKLLRYFRDQSLPVYHVQHLSKNPKSPLRPGQSGVDFIQDLAPLHGERVFQKHVNSAFIGTNLEEILRNSEIKDLVVCGIAVDHCVSTTTRMAANLGFNVTLAADAIIAHERKGFDGRIYDAELVHAVSLASLHGEFAAVSTTENLIKVLDGTNGTK